MVDLRKNTSWIPCLDYDWKLCVKNPGQGLCVRESRSGRCWIGSNDFWRYRFYYLILWRCHLHRVMSMRNTRCRSGRSIVSYEIILSYYGFSRRNQCLLIGWTEAWRLNAIGWRALWSVVIPCTKIVRQKKISRMCDMGMKLCEEKCEKRLYPRWNYQCESYHQERMWLRGMS